FIVTEFGPNVDAFMLHIYSAIAEKERALISIRTKEGLARKKASGAKLGNRRNLGEAARLGAATYVEAARARAKNVLPTIREIQASGVSSLRAISDALNKRGVPTHRGGVWDPASVARLLQRQYRQSFRELTRSRWTILL
ncbi:recombinase family protein, partial [Nostoc sp. NIES-2111]